MLNTDNICATTTYAPFGLGGFMYFNLRTPDISSGIYSMWNADKTDSIISFLDTMCATIPSLSIEGYQDQVSSQLFKETRTNFRGDIVLAWGIIFNEMVTIAHYLREQRQTTTTPSVSVSISPLQMWIIFEAKKVCDYLVSCGVLDENVQTPATDVFEETATFIDSIQNPYTVVKVKKTERVSVGFVKKALK